MRPPAPFINYHENRPIPVGTVTFRTFHGDRRNGPKAEEQENTPDRLMTCSVGDVTAFTDGWQQVSTVANRVIEKLAERMKNK